MANNDNLTPFKKGQSGNPKGRPKGSKNRSTIIKKWLEVEEKAINPITGEEELLSQEDIISLQAIGKARKGDISAYRAVKDCAYGAPVQQIDQTIMEQPLFPDVQEDNSDK